jgi:hypothetical protein
MENEIYVVAMGDIRNTHRILVKKRVKTLLGRLRSRDEDNIKKEANRRNILLTECNSSTIQKIAHLELIQRLSSTIQGC